MGQNVSEDSGRSDARFLAPDICSVDAAAVGISRHRWEGIEVASATAEAARKLMKERRYDVLPIVQNHHTTEYFATAVWNDYSVIERRTIAESDVLPADTAIEEVIRRFAAEERLFFFLSLTSAKGSEERSGLEVDGLVSVANLNSREVKVHLYTLLSEFEILLGELIRSRAEEAQLTAVLATRKWGAEALEPHNEDRERGLDVQLVEYLYLHQLLKVVRKFGLHADLGYSGNEFDDSFGSLTELRNRVSHPNRSLITDKSSVERLVRWIDAIRDGVERVAHELARGQ